MQFYRHSLKSKIKDQFKLKVLSISKINSQIREEDLCITQVNSHFYV